jgi:hypothetical protein
LYCTISQEGRTALSKFVEDAMPKSPYPNLKRHAIEQFDEYAAPFKYLLLSYSSEGTQKSSLLTFASESDSEWLSDLFSIKWNGKCWILLDKSKKGLAIARQELTYYKWECIPTLGCVQMGARVKGVWNSCDSHITDIDVVVANSSHIPAHDVTSVAPASSMTSDRLPVSNGVGKGPVASSLAASPSSAMLPHTALVAFNPASFIALNFDFFGWDTVLNSIAHLASCPAAHYEESHIWSGLKGLLERCLRLWEQRNDRNAEGECERFFKDAVMVVVNLPQTKQHLVQFSTNMDAFKLLVFGQPRNG